MVFSTANQLRSEMQNHSGQEGTSPHGILTADFGIIGTQPLHQSDDEDLVTPTTHSPSSAWPSLGGWSHNPTSPSIWNSVKSAGAVPVSPHRRASFEVHSHSQPRQQRSFSISAQHSFRQPDLAQFRAPFDPLHEDPVAGIAADFASFDLKQRSRSKSSNAAYGHLTNLDFTVPSPRSDHIVSAPTKFENYSHFPHTPQLMSATSPYRAVGEFPTHRRASTTPSAYNGTWPDEYPENASPEAIDRFRQQRRFSHAPASFYQDVLYPPTSDFPSPIGMENKRRHSIGGPLIGFGLDPLDNMSMTPNPPSSGNPAPVYKNMNDYFENTEHRTKAWVEAGKNLQLQTATSPVSPSSTWPLYVVEFKAGRRDFFYAQQNDHLSLKIGDLVIVEADRGKDLGKITHFPISDSVELETYRAQHPDVLVEMREVSPKKIFRKATNPEVQLLVPKSADEAKAVSVCTTKIKQRGLPMEVVDAEYQWDRRKLTFYFVSEKRIDFRELVRELFKMYKTRIWMCAVNPAEKIMNQ